MKSEKKKDIDIEYQGNIDYSDDVQYANAVFAIGRIETDNGGLTINEIWSETEELRKVMLRTPKEKRPIVIADSVSRNLITKYKDISSDAERTQMCILLLFALRLIKASRTNEDNPNREIIRAIARLISYKAKRDEKMMSNFLELMKTMDEDGNENEKNGLVIDFGVNILADDPEWNAELRHIVDKYIEIADQADVVARGKAGDAFDEVWNALVEDELFAAEMRESSLGKNYNLLLLFNVYGLMFPWAYSTNIRGAQSLAKTVGKNPDSRTKNKCYSKDYFSTNEIEKCKYGIKSDSMLKHIREIITKHKPEQ